MTKEDTFISLAGSLIELLGACAICYHVIWSLSSLVQGRGMYVARLRIAQGVLTALGFSVAGTLLKTIALQTWPQIRLFTFIFALRTLLKKIFSWEQRSAEEIQRRVAAATAS